MYQEAQTISRVQNGMMKTYFVLWDSKLQFGGAAERREKKNGEGSGEVLLCGCTSDEHEL